MCKSKIILMSTPNGTSIFMQKWIEQENKMKEQDIQAKIQKYIKAKGGYVIKNISSNRAGILDLTACYLGLFIAIEVKVIGNKPSPLQIANARAVRTSGGIAIIAYSTRDVADCIRLIDSAVSIGYTTLEVSTEFKNLMDAYL